MFSISREGGSNFYYSGVLFRLLVPLSVSFSLTHFLSPSRVDLDRIYVSSLLKKCLNITASPCLISRVYLNFVTVEVILLTPAKSPAFNRELYSPRTLCGSRLYYKGGNTNFRKFFILPFNFMQCLILIYCEFNNTLRRRIIVVPFILELHISNICLIQTHIFHSALN